MTKSQLAASARTPSRGLPTTGRGPATSPVMFCHEDSPYTTHRATAIVNITSTSQGTEAIIVGLRGNQDLLTVPIVNIENIDLREYLSDSKREHTIIA